MRNLPLLILFIFLFTIKLYSEDKPFAITYIHPSPNSKYITPQSTIILKINEEYKEEIKVSQFSFDVEGEKSGKHTGQTIISGNTIIFKPHSQFSTSEQVFVSISTDLPGWSTPFIYSFLTSNIKNFNHEFLNSISIQDLPQLQKSQEIKGNVSGQMRVIAGVSVPSDFPYWEPSTIGNGISSGRIFLHNMNGNGYIMILENDGTPYSYQRVKQGGINFKLQPNGMLTRRLGSDRGAFVGLDSNYTIIDTFQCANGFTTDFHELLVLEDGHYFLIARGYRTVNMSELVEGGDSSAKVIDNHIQEFDKNHNLIFEWLCYEHISILDAVNISLTSSSIDYIHINSIAVDYDGHIIISSRHLSEVTKINRQTGDIIWRFGGKNNEFNFINDEHQISFQHDAQPVPGKPNYYTIFDNGTKHDPKFSRVIEFHISTEDTTATKMWEYPQSPDPDRYTSLMGNAQRLPNGNTLINYAVDDLPKVEEVTITGEVVYEGDFITPSRVYRSFRFEWESVSDFPYLIIEPDPDKVTLIFNKFGDKEVDKYIVYAGQNEQSLLPIDTTTNPYSFITNLEDNTYYYFGVTAVNINGLESEISNIERALVNYVIPGENILINGNFTAGTDNWQLEVSGNADANGNIDELDKYKLTILKSGSEIRNIKLIQEGVVLEKGKKYRFEFDAYADSLRYFEAKLEQSSSPWINYSKTGLNIVSPQIQHYEFDFNMSDQTDFEARVVFNCGTDDSDLYFDNISLTEIGTTDIEEADEIIPEQYTLLQNYPNPFNPTTTITYFVPEPSKVKISIYNLLGETIRVIENNYINLGSHNIQLNAYNLSSGVYLYSIEAKSTISAKSFFDVKKMIILK